MASEAPIELGMENIQARDYNHGKTKAKITEIAVRLMSNDYAPGSLNNPEKDIDALVELAVLTVNDLTIAKSVVAALKTVVSEHKKVGGNADIRNMATEAFQLLRNTASSDVRATLGAPGIIRTIDAGL